MDATLMWSDTQTTETMQGYAEQHLPFKWCVGPPTRPVDMAERLGALGFEETRLRGMSLGTQTDVTAPDVQLKHVGPQDAQLFIETGLENWGPAANNPRVIAEFSHDMGRADRMFFIVYWQGEPAGTAAVILCPEVAYLIGAQVVPRFQGKGLYRALLRARLEAVRAVRPVAVIQALESTSAPILDRLGFESLFAVSLFESPTAAG